MSQYYNSQRTKGLYTPNASEPFKLSRSKIDLFLSCPRCFYFDRKLGVGRPPGFPFALNSAVTLTAVADSGSTFLGWEGACMGTGSCMTTMTETKAVTAAFVLNQYVLSVTVEGEGSGYVTSVPAGISCPGDCDEEYYYGTVVTLTAVVSDSVSEFGGWTGPCTGTADCVTTIEAIDFVAAVFDRIEFLVHLPIVHR